VTLEGEPSRGEKNCRRGRTASRLGFERGGVLNKRKTLGERGKLEEESRGKKIRRKRRPRLLPERRFKKVREVEEKMKPKESSSTHQISIDLEPRDLLGRSQVIKE